MKNYSYAVILSYIIGPILIIASHIGSLFVVFTGLSWGALLWIISLYFMRMLATTSIYHRLLTHKSYKAPKLITWLGSIIAASAGHMGPSWWKAHHVAHHQYVDKELDPHSPFTPNQGLKGFLWAQGGWLLSSSFFPEKLPADIEKDQVLKVIDRLHFLPVIALATLSYFIGGLEYLVAFCLSTTILFHGVQTVNSLSHLMGNQPFQTDDYSRNNAFVAFIAFGEGWHNLHHAFPTSSRHGITLDANKVLYLHDLTFTFIKGLEFVGLASKLRIPDEKALLERAKNPTYSSVHPHEVHS